MNATNSMMPISVRLNNISPNIESQRKQVMSAKNGVRYRSSGVISSTLKTPGRAQTQTMNDERTTAAGSP
jgi:hypothetical protein